MGIARVVPARAARSKGNDLCILTGKKQKGVDWWEDSDESSEGWRLGSERALMISIKMRL